jgi:hypothetical protein
VSRVRVRSQLQRPRRRALSQSAHRLMDLKCELRILKRFLIENAVLGSNCGSSFRTGCDAGSRVGATPSKQMTGNPRRIVEMPAHAKVYYVRR